MTPTIKNNKDVFGLKKLFKYEWVNGYEEIEKKFCLN